MTRPELICFDMDGTLIEENKWLDFNLCLGLTPTQDDALYEAFASGELSYHTWLERLREAYRLPRPNVTRDYVTTCLTQFTLQSGAVDALERAKALNVPTAVITGSFDTTAAAVAHALGIDHAIANTSCVFDTEDRLIDIESGGDEGEMKDRYLRALCVELNVSLESVIVVGDSGNDLPMF